MPSVTEIKAIRRHNLALLMATWGQAELAKATGLPPAYLYHMAKGTGKQARGVSDKNARLIESATGVERGWLDVDRRGAQPVSFAEEVQAAQLKRRHAWPFRTIARERFDALDDGDKLKVEGAALKALTAIERERSSSGKRKAS